MQPPFDDFTKIGNSALGTMKEFSDLATKTAEQLMELQMSVSTAYWQAAMKHMTQLAEAKGYEDMMSGQMSLMTAYQSAVVDGMKRAADILNTSKDEFTSLMERGMHAADRK